MIDDMFNYDQRFYELRGSSLNSVISKMGLPSNQYDLGDSKVYIWINTEDVMGYGGKREYGQSKADYLLSVPSSTHGCEVKMVVGSNNKVNRVEVDGQSQAACTPSKWDW